MAKASDKFLPPHTLPGAAASIEKVEKPERHEHRASEKCLPSQHSGPVSLSRLPVLLPQCSWGLGDTLLVRLPWVGLCRTIAPPGPRDAAQGLGSEPRAHFQALCRIPDPSAPRKPWFLLLMWLRSSRVHPPPSCPHPCKSPLIPPYTSPYIPPNPPISCLHLPYTPLHPTYTPYIPPTSFPCAPLPCGVALHHLTASREG